MCSWRKPPHLGGAIEREAQGAESVGGVAGGELGRQEGLSAAGDAAVSAYLAFSWTKQVMLRTQR